MSNKRNPYIRVPLVIAVGVMLYFMPTREFLKTTFIIGIPFIFLLGYLVRKPRYTWTWNLCALGMLAVLGLYGYNLVHLPERIQVHEIISSGAALVAEGQYDEAIAKYEQLDELGKTERMKEKIAEAQTEKDAHLQLDRARQLIDGGNNEEALQVIESIPPNTRVAREARMLRISIE